jgi:RNA polymerase sigma factor (sigma-70 family)
VAVNGENDDRADGADGFSPPGRAVDPWLRRFAARDGAAILEAEALVARIVAYRGFGFGRAEREDLVQEAMAQIWEAIGGGRFDAARSFEAFVRTVATRRCIDGHRSRRATSELSPHLVSPEADPESALLARERAEVGRRLLSGLGDGCRELIRLHATEGLTYAEIGRRLQRSEGALRVQMSECLSRARRLLREQDARDGGDAR